MKLNNRGIVAVVTALIAIPACIYAFGKNGPLVPSHEVEPRWKIDEQSDPFDKTYNCFVVDAGRNDGGFISLEPENKTLTYFFPAPENFYDKLPSALESARDTCLSDYKDDSEYWKSNCHKSGYYTVIQTNLVYDLRSEERIPISDSQVSGRNVFLMADLTREEAEQTNNPYVRYRLELAPLAFVAHKENHRIVDGSVAISDLVLAGELARECNARKASRRPADKTDQAIQ